MAVFYVMPPRPALGECLARVLQPFIPGAAINRPACTHFIDLLVSDSTAGVEGYVVYREDLPEGEDMETALREGFGAEEGDQVVLVSVWANPGEPRVKSWRLGEFRAVDRAFEVRAVREPAVSFSISKEIR